MLAVQQIRWGLIPNKLFYNFFKLNTANNMHPLGKLGSQTASEAYSTLELQYLAYIELTLFQEEQASKVNQAV